MEVLHTIVLILHIIGATLVVGASFVSLIVLFPKRVPLERLKVLKNVWSIAGPIMGIQLLTGLYLGISEWDEIGKNHLFWVKLILFIALGVISGRVLNKKLSSSLKKAADPVDMVGVKKWALASFIIFLLIVIFGVILAESQAR